MKSEGSGIATGTKKPNHSSLSDSTGFILADLRLFSETVSRLTVRTTNPAAAKNHYFISVLQTKFSSHLWIAQKVTGEAITKAIANQIMNSDEIINIISSVPAPFTFRIPISLVRLAISTEVTEYKPRQIITIARIEKMVVSFA